MLLSKDKARGYLGPGVLLTTDDNRELWSLTQRIAYWAGGLDPMERGSFPSECLQQAIFWKACRKLLAFS